MANLFGGASSLQQGHVIGHLLKDREVAEAQGLHCLTAGIGLQEEDTGDSNKNRTNTAKQLLTSQSASR